MEVARRLSSTQKSESEVASDVKGRKKKTKNE